MEATITPVLEKWLEARAIDPEVAARYGVRSIERQGTEWVVIPYVVDGLIVNNKYRELGTKRHAQDPDGQKVFWNQDVLKDTTLEGQPLIITEGEWDALTAIECGYNRTMSVPDGAPAKPQGGYDGGEKYSYVLPFRPQLQNIPEIILATDGDEPGGNLLSDLAIRIGRVRCKSLKYPRGCKDLNDAKMKYGNRGVVETINRAKWMAVPGTYTMSELPDEPAPVPYTLAMPTLRELWKPRLGDFIVITGSPGEGKSSLINAVCCDLAAQHNWRSSFLSPEQHPRHDHVRNLRTWHARKLMRDMTQPEFETADAWIEQHFRFVVPDEDDDVTLLWTLERFENDIIRHDVKVCVIDPWNEMDHDRPDGMNETDYIGFALRTIRRFGRKFRVIPIVAAHPQKIRRDKDGNIPIPTLWDISGSAHWANKADIGIVVARDRIRMAKVRFQGINGQLGEVKTQFLTHSNRFDIAEL